MPLALVTHAERLPQRRFTDTPSRVDAWQLLHREADRLYPELRTVWLTLFQDMQASVDTDALRSAVERGNFLEAQNLLYTRWQQVGDQAARQALPTLLRETVQRAAEAMIPATAEALGVATLEVSFNVVVPETLQLIEQYAGQQIVGISQTTLSNVRQVLRRGFSEGRTLTQLMADLEGFVGLTPRQTEAIEGLRTRLTEQGIAPRRVQQQVDQAARRALQLRVESIARTESISASMLGQEILWREAAQQGLLDTERFRRLWIVTPDDRLCRTICAPIPSRNSEGRRLDEPFDTPIGQIQRPPAHPMCRCALSSTVV